MNEQLANTENEFLWKLLANPADANHSYIFNLQLLVNDFPQSGALQALLIPNGDRRNLKHTAAYFDPAILHKLATAPDSLPVVTPDQLILSELSLPVTDDTYFTPPVAEPFVPPVIEEAVEYFPVTDDTFIKEVELPIADHEEKAELPVNIQDKEAEPVQDDNQELLPRDSLDEWKPTPANTYLEHTEINNAITPIDNTVPAIQETEIETGDGFEQEAIYYAPPTQTEQVAETETIAPIDEPAPETKEEMSDMPEAEESQLAKEYNEYLAQTNSNVHTETVDSFDDKTEYFQQDFNGKTEFFHQDIDDEIYDEIVSIEDIGLEQLAIINKTLAKDEAPAVNTDADHSINNSYFVFEPQLTESVAENEIPEPQPDTTRKVSRYNDEKMPYSFMWWLDKTRKEHADMYQPYVSNPQPAAAKAAKKEVADELQQQYYESIVSVNSIDELEQTGHKTSAPQSSRKADKIIERFIKEEPQIKHPGNVKLDNENKAKKSSEDRDELVTETLARIYTEQMLYHKAALTYKKLMLKYPEKSLYFAGQIEQLENKIN